MRLFHWAAFAVAVLGFVSGGIYFLVRDSDSDVMEIVLPTATPVIEVELKAYISGAVRSPGVYVIAEGERLSLLVEAAGGPVEDADLAAVNLAARVRDEDHWHIPYVGETVSAPPVQQSVQPSVININSADEEVLKSLPGIGEVKAKAIIRYREANGPFTSVDDLLAVSGIGPATLDAIRDLVEAR